MIRKGLFQSNATCTSRDRELEARINEKLAQFGRGRVALYTEEGDGGPQYGMVFSFGSRAKTFTRHSFELDIDRIVEGLAITAEGMENSGNMLGWTYDVDDADFVDTESYTDSIYAERSD
jgi:hypothetical protein